MSAGLLATLVTDNLIRWPRTGTDASGQPTWGSPAAATSSPIHPSEVLEVGPVNDRKVVTKQAYVSSTVTRGDKVVAGTYDAGTTPATPTATALEVFELRESTLPLDGEVVRLALMGG